MTRFQSYLVLVAIFIILLVSVTSSSAGTETTDKTDTDSVLEDLIEDIQQRVSGTRTVQADFEQERILTLFTQPIIFTGRMVVERPGRLRWENIEPIPSVLIFNGDKGMRCNDDAEPVHFELAGDPIMNMVAEQIWTWVDGDYGHLQNKYYITMPGEMSIQLVPNSGEFSNIIKSVEITFEEKSLQPQTIHVREAEGDSTIIRFSNYRLNEPVSEILFTSCYP